MNKIFTIHLFARAKEIANADFIQLSHESPCELGRLKQAIVDAFPSLSALARSSRLAVNQEYHSDDKKISDTDEIALIPPVSGG